MTADQTSDEQIRDAVRARYAAAAQGQLTLSRGGGCCGNGGCCGDGATAQPVERAQAVDPVSSGLYDEGDTPFEEALAASLGCGNPTALAQLRPGEDVLDLGSGGGLDVLLSARRVAPEGLAYGLDMTSEMVQLARRHQAEAGVRNARFLLGAIEDVPLPDAAVDVVISNCVVNLSPDKDAVLREAFRVLRPGGRFAVSDIVLLRSIPEQLRAVMSLWTGCISGALRDTDYVAKLTAAGFTQARVEVTRRYERAELEAMADQLDEQHLPAGMGLADAVDALDGAFASAFVRATRPS